VNTAFIQKMKEKGFKDLSIEEMIEMRIHGFDREL
jgi:hypothetical protein